MDRDPRKYYLDDKDYHPKNLTKPERAARYYGLPEDTSLAAQVPPFKETGIAQSDAIIHELIKMVRIPQTNPNLFDRKKIRPYRGAVLEGLPGTGKSRIADSLKLACSRMPTKVAFFDLRLAVVLDGNPGNNMEKAFDAADRLRPSFIFIDEFDAILKDTRTPMDLHFLLLLDGINDRVDVFVLVATNSPASIGQALRRPGRLEVKFELELPSFEERKSILTVVAEGLTIDRAHFTSVANATNGFSIADLAAVIRKAKLTAFDRLNTSLVNLDPDTWGILDEKVDITKEDMDAGVAFIEKTKGPAPAEDDATTA